MKDKWFYLAIAVVVLTAWMFRWEITPLGDGQEQYAEWTFWIKLDRLTGNTYLCMNIGCTSHELFEEIKQ